MNIPDPEKIEGTDIELPYSLVDDEIFPLQNWLVRPSSGKALVNEQRKIFDRDYREHAESLKILLGLWSLVGEYFKG